MRICGLFKIQPGLAQRLRGHKDARAASSAASACRDELALIVFVFRASHSSLAERGSDSIAPGRRTPLSRSLALTPVPLTPLADATTASLAGTVWLQ